MSLSAAKPSLLFIGLPVDHPAVKALIDPAVVQKMVDDTVVEMQGAGYKDFQLVWASPEQGLGDLERHLKGDKHWDGTIIGAGLRKSDSMMPLVEDIISTVQELSPRTRIVFNTTPKDNQAAAERVIRR